MRAWNGWYHVSGSTYGTWLRGDLRGWREWKHHEHVDGDYRNRPVPEACKPALDQSLRRMKRPPVRLTAGQRDLAGRAIVEKLSELGAEVIAASVDAVHYHVLGRFDDGEVRLRVGQAKKNAAHVLRALGLSGGVWAKRCQALPVRSRQHQVNVYKYILGHGQRGAWTWSFREGLYWLSDGSRDEIEEPTERGPEEPMERGREEPTERG